MSTALFESNKRTMPGNIGHAILGFVYAVAAYQVPALITAFLTTSTGVGDFAMVSILIQIVVGILVSMLAYGTASNPSLKFGMRICYGLVLGVLFVFGVYTIVTSF